MNKPTLEEYVAWCKETGRDSKDYINFRYYMIHLKEVSNDG